MEKRKSEEKPKIAEENLQMRKETQKSTKADVLKNKTEDGSRLRVMTESEISHKISEHKTFESDVRKRSQTGKSESDRSSGDFSTYRPIASPSPSMREASHSAAGHKTPDYYKYETISPTFDSRARNISGDYRDAVEKSLTTSQNLMSVVTGSLVQKSEQPRSRPQSQNTSQKPPVKKTNTDSDKEKELRKKMEIEKNKVAGVISDIMIKEVGTNWVSLCWKKPPVSRGSPVITYKVESWLCGEGAFWVELGRTPIPQFDAFNLKPNKCYHFRVTARNKSGWGDSLMTMHKVDLSKPTQMPVITTSMDSTIKALQGSSVKLTVQVSGEPYPKVSWHKDLVDTKNIHGTSTQEDGSIHHIEIENVNKETEGKYTITAMNTAGRTTKSIQIQMIDNEEVFMAQKQFDKWQTLIQSPAAPYMIIGPRDRRVEEGQSIQLTCRVVSNPWPMVRWFKNKEQLIPDDYTNIYNEADFQHVQIDDITVDHSGQYSVEAFNEHGSIESYFSLIVDKGLDRYMPPFFTRELRDIVINKGCNLLLHCRVESYPYIGVTWHKSGSKIRLGKDDYKMVDDDGNVILVLSDVEDNHSYSCTILNEIAENLTTCQVIVNTPEAPLVQLDEDIIRYIAILFFFLIEFINLGTPLHLVSHIGQQIKMLMKERP